ncbi:MAG TPA: GldG family protein [Chloroflexota bacterium]|nr:GldG family protein [Chloroflexota bacterium]
MTNTPNDRRDVPDDTFEEQYEEASAFYRFSAFLGALAIALFASALVVHNASGGFTRNVGALLAIGVVFAVLYATPRAGEIMAAMRTRTARQGGNVTLMSVAFIGLLVVANWFANRHSEQWDLTAARRFTLSDQTMKIISQVDRPVRVIAFFPERQADSYIQSTKDLLRQYDRRSDMITLEFVDPEVNPGLARQYDLKSYPITIFTAGDRKEETTGITEQDFTSALLKLTRETQKKVYFLQGHQERDFNNSGQGGYFQAAEALKRENYLVEPLSLLAGGRVPDDAAVLVIAGPKAPLLDPERQAIDEYLSRGGHVLYLAEPRQDFGLDPLLQQWHIELGNNLVIDEGRSYPGDPLTPAPVPQSGHRITTSLPDVLLPGTRTVSVTPGAGSDLAIVPLLRTTDRSWGETNFNAPARPDPGQDLMGPLTVAVAVHKTDPAQPVNPATQLGQALTTPVPSTTPKGRLVVIGNAEFASNTYFNQVLGNRDFFLNSVNWLAEEEELISIRAEPATAPPIVLTNQSSVLVLYSTVIFVPLAVLLLGGVVWWQRR